MAVVAQKPPLTFSDKKILRPLMDALAEEMEIPKMPHASARESQRLISADLANNGINVEARIFSADLNDMRRDQ